MAVSCLLATSGVSMRSITGEMVKVISVSLWGWPIPLARPADSPTSSARIADELLSRIRAIGKKP